MGVFRKGLGAAAVGLMMAASACASAPQPYAGWGPNQIPRVDGMVRVTCPGGVQVYVVRGEFVSLSDACADPKSPVVAAQPTRVSSAD